MPSAGAPELLIEFRLSGSELVEGGLTIDDQVEFAKLLDGKVDLIHVTAGTFHYPETNQHMVPEHVPPIWRQCGICGRY